MGCSRMSVIPSVNIWLLTVFVSMNDLGYGDHTVKCCYARCSVEEKTEITDEKTKIKIYC